MVHWIKGFWIWGFLLLFSSENRGDIRYFQPSTIPIADSVDLQVHLIDASLDEGEIFMASTCDGKPLYYFMELHTGVCFDNKCRPLFIMVYWNITGRYLGFELLDGEFLSKYEHEPFSPTEYEQLHGLLADPFLPLGNYSFEELVAIPDVGDPSVDGVSGATSKDVLDYVVPGAAYTTHKLWKVVHGPIQQQLIRLTEQRLDTGLFSEIFHSPDQSDQIWALERVSRLPELDHALLESMVQLLKDDEYFQAYLLLKSLSSDQLSMEGLQVRFFQLLGQVAPGTADLIIDRFADAPRLTPVVVDQLSSVVGQLSGGQLVKLLKLLSHHDVRDAGLNAALGRLIPHDNSFVQHQVVHFLDKQASISE
ncbi:MAG: hypothetical protein JJU34_13290 [Lunatimonas sp.]|uniref:hypothetical protein n=1 Tax=Lunatimonas sp. TaxID=2060141 RepID=UPI00263B89E9|nr:hypothetical protein [Lunatimonas sp.]MCC5938247.1 hypothetical protein [Lunatimonas sp.]